MSLSDNGPQSTQTEPVYLHNSTVEPTSSDHAQHESEPTYHSATLQSPTNHEQSLNSQTCHNLGRDDPLWPRYVEEAEKWDGVMMSKWNDSMDVLLLFATLFSAIVTAFVIQTSGGLEPDNAAISASALAQIAQTLQILASGGQPSQNLTTFTPSPENFEPSMRLFLVGLILFLQDLNRTIYLATLVITATTVAIYAGTTVLPFFSTFCPYGTPLSSPKAWGYFHQCFRYLWIRVYKLFVNTSASPDLANFNFWSTCKEKEREVSYSTTPDDITGHALNWIIIHSQTSDTREMAIRAIAGLNSEKTLEQLVASPPGIFPQVVQSFTACFSLGSQGEEGFNLVPEKSVDDIAQHGTALAILANRTALGFPGDDSEHLVKWGVDDTTKEAVKERFQWLAERDGKAEPHAKAMGLVGLSAWYNFIGQKELRFKRGDIVGRLVEIIDWSLPEHLCTRILHAIMAESVYWAPDVDGKHKMNILTRLIALLPHTTSNKLRSQLACSLAVLGLGLNHGSAHLKGWIIPRPNIDPEADGGRNAAETLAEYYTKSPKKIARDEQALMLLALTCLMEHYEHCNFGEETYENLKIIAEQISSLDNLGKSRAIILPKHTGLYLDVRGYFVQILVAYFKQVQTPERGDAIDETFVRLLGAVRSKRQVWIEHGPLLILPITHLLAHTDSTEVIGECLNAIITNWDLGPAILYSRMLLAAHVPHKLVKHISRLNHGASTTQTIINSNTAMLFEKFATQVENNRTQFMESAGPMLSCFFENILQDNLLQTFVRNILRLGIAIPSSNSQGPEAANPSQSPELVDNELLYSRTLGHLKQCAERGSKLHWNELFLKTLFDLRAEVPITDRVQPPPSENVQPDRQVPKSNVGTAFPEPRVQVTSS